MRTKLKRTKLEDCGFCILLRRIGMIVLFVFGGWMVFSLAMHGGYTAVNGKIADGSFFLGSHGKFREVSESLFVFLRGLEIVVLGAFGFGFILLLVLAFGNAVCFPDCDCKARRRSD